MDDNSLISLISFLLTVTCLTPTQNLFNQSKFIQEDWLKYQNQFQSIVLVSFIWLQTIKTFNK